MVRTRAGRLVTGGLCAATALLAATVLTLTAQAAPLPEPRPAAGEPATTPAKTPAKTPATPPAKTPAPGRTPAGLTVRPAPKDTVTVLDWLATIRSGTRPDRVRTGADWTVFGHLYENEKGAPGKRIGDTTAHCAAVEVTPRGALTQCQRVLRTDGGTLTLGDAADRFGPAPHGVTSAITGGTGVYKDAEGEVEIVEYEDRVTFRVTLED
ncbi:hypothetical protein [Streptomyces sp. SP18CS02]|uniref:hypothetical protein n=1 Tax=Streptomyces sp. SP18CS02 TaxID=3002531 RepID=UPI002E782FD4|nr:hypothetical protein [Streptomyces sp. SP18CS02]MEE1753240.1 hypothetical protein [Streptomyces sp. SP18CS02]